MFSKVFSLKSISTFLALSTLTVTFAIASANVATAQTREQSVDGVTDWLFGNLHPQLNRRKLRSDEYQYIREWNAIRAVINQGGLQYQRANPNHRACDIPDWYYSNDDEALRERLADAVFYSRYPERKGRPIAPDERGAMRVWLKLKNSMYVAYC
ncbi:hypothetical protein ACQ4M3_24240 [Leptolyngbya sp. AN03gr2]|uniref:hypothetical protein n=1 Tax=unclassified Leptolyngbya TaxID=2650499 RepID=UPI003D31D295